MRRKKEIVLKVVEYRLEKFKLSEVHQWAWNNNDFYNVWEHARAKERYDDLTSKVNELEWVLDRDIDGGHICEFHLTQTPDKDGLKTMICSKCGEIRPI